MYEFSKKVLLKVSFDRVLFKKELLKTKKWLKREESIMLQAWCLSTFGHIYRDTIMDVFEMV
jgi:ACT domain-containing protein